MELNKDNVVKILQDWIKKMKEQQTHEYKEKGLEVMKKIQNWELKPERMPEEFKPYKHPFNKFR